ncbi:FkbM family methyltransferase [Rhodobacter lacus]|uniref:FkbM family methyltransferase n=1 Tax=Rhodobacter lacus TaxID=1641972 RepID=A0ABW5AC45_9RHOB
MIHAFRDALPASLVLIGPPSGEALAPLIAEAPGTVVLVEPNPDLAARLERDFAQRERVRVLSFGVDATPGRAELSSFNFPGLRSLRRPTPALRALLPGLQLRASQSVEVITPAKLFERIGPLSRPLHLWIDAAGSELAILEGLHAAGALEEIDQIRLSCPAEEMFEGGSCLARVRSWATEQGLRVGAENLQDPDWPELTLDLDLTAQHLQQTRQELARQIAQTETLQSQLSERAAEHERLEAQNAALTARAEAAEAAIGARDAQLNAAAQQQAAATQALADAQAETAALKDALEAAKTQNGALAEACAETEARAQGAEASVAKREAQLAELRNELTNLAASQEGMQAALTRANSETAAMEARALAAENALRQSAARLEAAETEAARVADRLEQKDLDLGVAMRSQAAAQSDLLDLRHRFEALQAEKQMLDALLTQVTSRLNAASQHLHMLTELPADPALAQMSQRSIDTVSAQGETGKDGARS